MEERVRSILKRVYNEEYVETCFDEAWDANVADMINKELTNDEIVEFINDIGGSEIFCDKEYVLGYLNDIGVFELDDFIDLVKESKGSVVYTKLATGKVIVIYQ